MGADSLSPSSSSSLDHAKTPFLFAHTEPFLFFLFTTNPHKTEDFSWNLFSRDSFFFPSPPLPETKTDNDDHVQNTRKAQPYTKKETRPVLLIKHRQNKKKETTTSKQRKGNGNSDEDLGGRTILNPQS
ncbi:unnamed protein product [Linum tenue]|uniref:Uncharacterized protein n=1 Tax=Linum tenue TaxID=586396 RepID=A0AAV0KPZ5_9ROSI|nr:unnamed protein product [Linum tenue]CAI0424162.1 unnamed protein product [Linum tenue]